MLSTEELTRRVAIEAAQNTVRIGPGVIEAAASILAGPVPGIAQEVTSHPLHYTHH